MDYLQLENKRIIIFGVANKKSVAYNIACQLNENGALCDFVVLNDEVKSKVEKLFPNRPVYTCDVREQESLHALSQTLLSNGVKYDGLVHSIAFADYSDGMKPFHQTPKKAFLEAIDVSCYSLINISNEFKDLLNPQASVVTISISTTRMASENYGYMAPIKAALDSSIVFLTKSFSAFSQIRFNAVAPGLLKTSASAGIPGYVDSYLYAEKIIPRQQAVQTEEAAATAVFLLSPRSSGIVAQKIIVDAGMDINYFDKKLVSPQ